MLSNIETRFTALITAIRKCRGSWGLAAQMGFTRTQMDINLLRKHRVRRTVQGEKVQMDGKTYTLPVKSQWVWSLGLGLANEWFYGNTLDECLRKAERRYRRWISPVTIGQ